MSDQTEYRTGDLPNQVDVKQLRNLYDISTGVGASSTTNIIAELEKITQNTADIEVKAENINLNTDTLEALIGATNIRGGTNGEAASTTGSQAAQLRSVAESLSTLVSTLLSDVATETTLSSADTKLGTVNTNLTTIDTAIDLSNERAFGTAGVETVTDTATHSVAFNGFYIHKPVSLGAATAFSNQTGNSLANVNLPVGYYPYAGTAFAFAASGGIATLVKD